MTVGSIIRFGLGVWIGIYLGIAAVTAVLAGPTSKLECAASLPVSFGVSVSVGIVWPATLPGMLRTIHHPERWDPESRLRKLKPL